MDNLLQDIRHALRIMRRNKGFTAAALLTLALGIGINITVFSLVYGVLLRPLPYPEPARLVRLSEEHPGATSPLRVPRLSNWTFYAWSESPRTIEVIAAYNSRRYTITGFDEPLRVDGAAVSPLVFSMLRATPASGRFFLPEEAAEGANLVILSDGFWRQHFGADPGAIGRTLIVDGRPHTIVGITRPAFYFPDHDTRLWTPFVVGKPSISANRGGSVSVFFALARLKPGVTTAQAEAEGTAAARGVGPRPRAADLLFGAGGPVQVHVRTLVEETTLGVRHALLVLAVGVGLVLLIACANVANLFLSRGLARQRELAVRAALGAGRGRLIRQLLTESLVLSIGGGLIGVVIGWGLTKGLPAIAPPDFPRLDEVSVDGRVLAFAFLASIFAGVASGLAPAIRSARFTLAESIHAGTWSSVGGFRGAWASRLRGALLVGEATLAVMLLIGAGLLIRSFGRLIAVDAGYDPANVITARIYPPGSEKAPERNRQFLDALLDRLRQNPGVVAAGAGNMAPFARSTAIAGFTLPAREGGDKPKFARALQHVVTPGYAEALGLRLREGRFFTEQDAGGGMQVMLVNQEFVRQYLSSGPVAGRRYQGLMSTPERITEIVGVVGDVLKDSLDGRVQPEIYLLQQQDRLIDYQIGVVVRTIGDPISVVPMLRSFVRELDRNAALEDVGPLARQVSASVSQPRFATTVLSTFASLALLLAAVGLYGVLSYNVTQRRRELGVRAALGASRQDLVWLVLRQGMALTIAGLVLGVAGAAGLTRLMTTLLFGVTPLDVIAFSSAPLILLLVACVACLLPAWKAASADPAEALRCE